MSTADIEQKAGKPALGTMTAAYILLVAVIALLPGKIPYETVREGGPVETLSAGGYFLFCLFVVYFNVTNIFRTSFIPAFFIFLLGLRELDFHARFTTMGMFKSRFFISPEVPVGEKVVVVAFILALLTMGGVYLRRRWPRFKDDLMAARPYALSLVYACGCLVLSKLLDGNSEVFEVLLPIDETSNLPRIAEECMELFIPIFLLRALIQYGEEELWFGKTGRRTPSS